ncbi:MAG: class I SAM-dependent methyltransferase [Ignavibacteria bacterium]|nr:class I SAM-dependent methyltransferase [Ignavibacteria bacterium]
MSVFASSGEKASRREDWEVFWREKQDVGRVYSNEDRILRNLLHLTDLRGKRVLEVGAGTGRDSFPLIQHGAIVCQLDYSEGSLRILKRLADDSHLPALTVGGDTFRLPFRDESFDIVFHQGLLEHFRPAQAEALLRENIRVLRSGGYLLVDVPQRYHMYTVAKHILMAFDKWFAGWERSFSVGELTSLLDSLGLKTVHAYGEWMYPSFVYRSFREALKRLRIELPLNPQPLKLLSRIRAKVRSGLWKTRLPLYSGISVGVVGKKT